jgi:hypothetical protein
LLAVVETIVAQDLSASRVEGADLFAAMNQPVGLVEVDGLRDIGRNDGIVLADFGDAIHLHRQQHRDVLPLQIASQGNYGGGSPTVTEKDDSSIPSFRVGQNAVVIGIEQPDNGTVSTLPVTVFKRLDDDARRIGFAEPLSQFDRPVMGIIVTDKPTDKTNNDVGRGGSSRTYERDLRGMNA